eukprot:4957446-Alexandrium_andersonii.AAC.1
MLRPFQNSSSRTPFVTQEQRKRGHSSPPTTIRLQTGSNQARTRLASGRQTSDTAPLAKARASLPLTASD